MLKKNSVYRVSGFCVVLDVVRWLLPKVLFAAPLFVVASRIAKNVSGGSYALSQVMHWLETLARLSKMFYSLTWKKRVNFYEIFVFVFSRKQYEIAIIINAKYVQLWIFLAWTPPCVQDRMWSKYSDVFELLWNFLFEVHLSFVSHEMHFIL